MHPRRLPSTGVRASMFCLIISVPESALIIFAAQVSYLIYPFSLLNTSIPEPQL
jgi:hypothetical protein